MSFAQSGEDLIANFIFHYLQIPKIAYMDVGAHDPVAVNNTYFFYRSGFRGVLVEPNVEMCKQLRAVRPQDTTLEAGIGVTAAREADYYLMTESAWNTFSKEEAEHMTRVTGAASRSNASSRCRCSRSTTSWRSISTARRRSSQSMPRVSTWPS